MLENIHEIFFSKILGKISGNFGNFSLLAKVRHADFFFISAPKKLGTLKNPRALNFLAFGSSYSAQYLWAPYKC